MNKKNKLNKGHIIGLGSLAIVTLSMGIIFSSQISKNLSKEEGNIKMSADELNQILSVDDEDFGNELSRSKYVSKYPINDEFDLTEASVIDWSAGEGKPIMDSSNARRYEIEIKALLSEFKINEAHERILRISESYNLGDEELSQSFRSIMGDVAIMTNIPKYGSQRYVRETNEVGRDSFLIGMSQGITHPDNLLIMFLSLENEVRESMVLAIDSINPTFEEKNVTIAQQRFLTEGYHFDDLKPIYSNMKELIVIDFIVDSQKLQAFIIKDDLELIRLHSIRKTDDETKYLTFRQLGKMTENYEKGIAVGEGVDFSLHLKPLE